MDSHTFSMIPRAEIPRSSFNRSFNLKTAFNETDLIPVYVDEVLPGDTITLRGSFFARLATPVVPVFDNLYLDVFYFYVPNRLVWDNWTKFMGEQDSPTDTTDYTVPKIVAPAGGFDKESIYDYMGVPPKVPGIEVNALPFRAYKLIHHEWFRDQNLMQSTKPYKGDSAESSTAYARLPRAKRHDYFTSALPWPQKGDGVDLPIGSTAPVIPTNANSVPPTFWTGGASTGGAMKARAQDASSPLFPGELSLPTNSIPASGADATVYWSTTGLVADLSNATAATINNLRQAFQIQKLLERDARGGTRYTELIRSHFGVVSPDARLQRPEFLGGGTINVNVNPVTQTSASGTYADTPQGNLAAYAVAAKSGIGFSKSFTEHGYIIGLVNLRADLNYQQGIPREFSRKTRFDFYWPAFAHLGEQAILNKEIYAQGPAIINSSSGLPYDDEPFGYQERFAEYRYKPSLITGKMRSYTADPAQSLDVWHLAQEFTTLPALNSDFIVDKPPMNRVVAVTNEPKVLMDAHFSIRAARPMPVYSVPGYIDHF